MPGLKRTGEECTRRDGRAARRRRVPNVSETRGNLIDLRCAARSTKRGKEERLRRLKWHVRASGTNGREAGGRARDRDKGDAKIGC